MKDLRQEKDPATEMSLADHVAKMKPQFATNKEALDFYKTKLDALTKRCGRSVQELLTQFENSAEQDLRYRYPNRKYLKGSP